MKRISLVIPCRDEEDNLPLLVSKIVKFIPKIYKFEIIFVDDGSTDKTTQVINKLSSKFKFVRGLILTKGFGQQAALIAGLNFAKGDAVITMDADLQHPPEMLTKIIESWENGHDLVLLQERQYWRSQKRARITTSIGYLIWRWVTNGFLIPGVSEFRLMDKRIVEYLLASHEKEIFLRGLVKLPARNSEILPYKAEKRTHGESVYRLSTSLDVFINGLISFSTKPLRITAFLGLIIFLASLVFLTLDLIMAILSRHQIVSGYVTIVFLMSFLNGFIIFYLGLMGEYVGVIFKEVKARPTYIIEKKINF